MYCIDCRQFLSDLFCILSDIVHVRSSWRTTPSYLLTWIWYSPCKELVKNDSQLLAHMKINKVMEHRRWLETCVESLWDWCASRRLQLNPDKTELIWFGSRVNLVKLRQLDVMSLNLWSVAVESVDSVKDLGLNIDNELSIRVHICKILSACFFHLRYLRKIRPLIDTASAQRLTSTFILSRIDWNWNWNSFIQQQLT